MGQACGGLCQVRPSPYRLQLLQEPALPQVPGTGGARLDGSACRGSAPGHAVFTLPAEIARIASCNKRAVYGLLFKGVGMTAIGPKECPKAETVMTIAAGPKRLGARVGVTSVLHTWGSALTHPHIPMIVPTGGLLPEGTWWVTCKRGFLLHVRVLSRLFRRLFLDGLRDLHRAGQLVFLSDLAELADARTFTA